MLMRPQERIPVPSQSNSEGASSVLWVTESPAVPAPRSPSLRILPPEPEELHCAGAPWTCLPSCPHGTPITSSHWTVPAH